MSGERFNAESVEIDKPNHECGVFGIYLPGENVSQLTFYGLQGLQHRGQESAGIAVSSQGSDEISSKKIMGLVRNFSNEEIESLRGDIAIGHTRYSNTGRNSIVNAQPAVIEGIAIAENGNLVNSPQLKRELENLGYNSSVDQDEKCSSDGELIAQAIHAAEGTNIVEKIQNASRDFEGAYSLTILSGDSLVGVRDPKGVWPLALGELNGTGFVLASESSAFDTIGAKYIRELDPGEIILIGENGPQSFQLPYAEECEARCTFDVNYLLRPDSKLPSGESVSQVRKRLGQVLARKFPVDADIVAEVPNSGQFGAIGYSQESGIPLEAIFIKNQYIGRTFIDPDQRIRERGVSLKLNVIEEEIAGKRIVLIDDSIVRGTTSMQITSMLFEKGAAEVHWRSTYPQVVDTCSLGVDMKSKGELISATRMPEEVAEEIGATSVAFNSLEDFLEATGMTKETSCAGCVTGEYPLSVPANISKFALEVT